MNDLKPIQYSTALSMSRSRNMPKIQNYFLAKVVQNVGHIQPLLSEVRATIFQDLIIMSVTVSEKIVPELKVSFNPTVVEESVNAEDAVLECLDGTRFAIVKRELAYFSGFFK